MSAERPPRPSLRRVALVTGLGLLALFALIQLVPYGRDHTNPPVTQAAALDPGTRAIVTETCADCHSNTTRWPWGPRTVCAPASWFARSDVDGGRRRPELLRVGPRPQPAVEELAEVIASGQMPPRKYRILPNHAKARLSGAERPA